MQVIVDSTREPEVQTNLAAKSVEGTLKVSKFYTSDLGLSIETEDGRFVMAEELPSAPDERGRNSTIKNNEWDNRVACNLCVI